MLATDVFWQTQGDIIMLQNSAHLDTLFELASKVAFVLIGEQNKNGKMCGPDPTPIRLSHALSSRF
jgi:hypothetical protein